MATGVAVGGGLRNADNLARDAEGNMYIVEDRNGGSDDDIWFAVDLNKDGAMDIVTSTNRGTYIFWGKRPGK